MFDLIKDELQRCHMIAFLHFRTVTGKQGDRDVREISDSFLRISDVPFSDASSDKCRDIASILFGECLAVSYLLGSAARIGVRNATAALYDTGDSPGGLRAGVCNPGLSSFSGHGIHGTGYRKARRAGQNDMPCIEADRSGFDDPSWRSSFPACDALYDKSGNLFAPHGNGFLVWRCCCL